MAAMIGEELRVQQHVTIAEHDEIAARADDGEVAQPCQTKASVLLPDVLHHGERPCLAEMIEAHSRHGGNHIAVSPVPEDQTHRYGILDVEDASAKVSKIRGMVEKPPRGTAPSNLHITGRYILQPTIFTLLENQERGAGGEIQLTDAMIRLMKTEPFHAVRFDGAIYDCGSKIGFLTANLAYALERENLAGPLREEIAQLLRRAD